MRATMLLMFLAAVAVEPAGAAEPAGEKPEGKAQPRKSFLTPEVLAKLAGKSVRIQHDLDLDADGEISHGETRMLIMMLKEAGVKVIAGAAAAEGKSGPDEVLILGDVVPPEADTRKTKDPVAVFGYEKYQEMEKTYRAELPTIQAKATKAGATVLRGDEAMAFFGLGEKIRPAFLRWRCAWIAEKANRELPEVRFDGVALVDTLAFMQDVSDLSIQVDWRMLEAAGVDKLAPVTYQTGAVRLDKALATILEKAAPDKAMVVARLGGLLLTTKARGEELLKGTGARRDVLRLDELPDPPAAALLPLPEALNAYRKRLPQMESKGELLLEDALEFLKDLTGKKIEADWPVLQAAGIAKDALVEVGPFAATPLYRALREIAAATPGGKAVFYLTKDGNVRLTTREAAAKAADQALILE